MTLKPEKRILYENDDVQGTHIEWVICRSIKHRRQGPAYIHYDTDGTTTKRWYQHNQLHREDGPAVVVRDEDNNVEYLQWAISGLTYTKPEYLRHLEQSGVSQNDIRDIIQRWGI